MASGWQPPMSSAAAVAHGSHSQSYTLAAMAGTSAPGPSSRPISYFRPDQGIPGPAGDPGRPPMPVRAPAPPPAPAPAPAPTPPAPAPTPPAPASAPAPAKDEKAVEEVDADAIYGQHFTNFVRNAEEVTPTIPDAVTNYVMSTAGLQVDDPRILRLISLACQKFIADITNDAMQHCKIRLAQQLKAQKQSKPKFSLTMDDLLPTLKERGINVKKPPYFV